MPLFLSYACIYFDVQLQLKLVSTPIYLFGNALQLQ